MLLVEHQKLNLLEEIPEGLLVLLSLNLQRFDMLTQCIYLALHLPDLLIFRLAAKTIAAANSLQEVQLAVEDAAARATNPNQLALLRKFAPSEGASRPGLNGPNSPPQVL